MAQPLFNIQPTKDNSFTFKTEEQKKIHAQVNYECDDMDKYAAPARQAGKDAIQGYMALTLRDYQDNRSRLFIPKIHAITYARMSMEAANLPKVEYKARKSQNRGKMKFLNAARENAEQGDGDLRADARNLWFHQNFDKILLGTGFRYLTYLLQRRVVTIRDDNDKPIEKTLIVYDDVWDEVPDFFHVGVSRDTQPGMFGGSYCYYDKFFNRDHFVERFDTPYYHNVKKAAAASDWFAGDAPYSWDVPENWVRVRYYWNVYKDLFYVQANGIPIRKDEILDYGPDGKKFLPITSIHNDINYDLQESSIPTILQGGRIYSEAKKVSTNRSFWTMGDAKLVQGLVGFSNSIWRAAHDHTKASSVHFLLAQSAGVFDQVRTADLYGIIPLKTQSNETFDVKSLAQGSDYLAKFQGMDEAIDNLMTYSLGNDWKRAAAELTNEKATVAAIRQQVQRVRMAQNTKFNETGGIKRHYRILLGLIQQYYPKKTLVDLGNDELPEGTDEKDVVRNLEGKPIGYYKNKFIPMDEEMVEIEENGKFKLVGKDHKKAKDKDASKLVPMRKEHIVVDEEPEIYIEPGSSFYELKALERAQYLDFMQAIVPFLGIQTTEGPIVPIKGIQYVIKQVAGTFEKVDPDKLFEDEKSQEDEMPPMPFDFTQNKGMATKETIGATPEPPIMPMNPLSRMVTP